MNRNPQFRAKLWNAAKTGTETVYVWAINPIKGKATISVYQDGERTEVESGRLSSFTAVRA